MREGAGPSALQPWTHNAAAPARVALRGTAAASDAALSAAERPVAGEWPTPGRSATTTPSRTMRCHAGLPTSVA